MRTHTHAHTPKYTSTLTYTYAYPYTCTHMHTNLHTCISRAHTQTYTHAYPYTYTHTCKHVHSQVGVPIREPLFEANLVFLLAHFWPSLGECLGVALTGERGTESPASSPASSSAPTEGISCFPSPSFGHEGSWQGMWAGHWCWPHPLAQGTVSGCSLSLGLGTGAAYA